LDEKKICVKAACIMLAKLTTDCGQGPDIDNWHSFSIILSDSLGVNYSKKT